MRLIVPAFPTPMLNASQQAMDLPPDSKHKDTILNHIKGQIHVCGVVFSAVVVVLYFGGGNLYPTKLNLCYIIYNLEENSYLDTDATYLKSLFYTYG